MVYLARGGRQIKSDGNDSGNSEQANNSGRQFARGYFKGNVVGR